MQAALLPRASSCTYNKQFFNLSKEKNYGCGQKNPMGEKKKNGLKLLEVNHLIVMHINAPLCVCLLDWASMEALMGRCAWTQGMSPPHHNTTQVKSFLKACMYFS